MGVREEEKESESSRITFLNPIHKEKITQIQSKLNLSELLYYKIQIDAKNIQAKYKKLIKLKAYFGEKLKARNIKK